MNGLLLAMQFFTAIPVRKELPLGRREVTAMYVAFPFVGAAIGLAMYIVSEIVLNYLEFGTFLAAVLIVLVGIVLTGGLHLDGWADTGDAFFSYKDREKRLEILEDPRLGAFGTMALVLLIIVKIAVFNEILMRGTGNIALYIAIPFLARAAMNLYFSTVRLAKDKGIAHFFKQKISSSIVIGWTLVSSAMILFALGFMLKSILIPVSVAIVIAMAFFMFRNWSLKHFGGVSGDLCGAFIEGMEALLWLVILCFI
ncbi:adenosylcobinamide-GDP ribazoletransferase [Sporosarcina sp. ANT_H38]|uniref:adenosylcobinamide-GDP ribazoletransferase n=1 Tax=Sporosarcina sp. ANT_H38 TaxID=2597358 RepID=UPI0011F0E53D|nr:adenosylcobinamide-GDP ribazoletransferase [Sporosarcina sp. ANT_H38]KAA0955686.1 adenosylcobinamide-GDP ribazoletransferase [Sporosarcina sp. ANT_H38]